jgi:c-di-GMP-binding flagellar brake protein YcgR
VPDSGLRVRAWRIDDQTSPLSVPKTPAISTDLRDLSVGGLGVVLRPATKPNPPVRQGDRLRIEVTSGGRTLTVAARVRQAPRRLPDGSLRLGLDFEELDHTIEGRRTQTQLAHLVAELERVEARRRAG